MFQRSLTIKKYLDCDLTSFPAVAYLVLVYFISRIPFIGLGFGSFSSQTDYDILAVVNSAYLLRYDQVYTVSRYPGYPFYEFINALFINGGWIATNAATMAVSFISIIIFAKILNLFQVKNKSILVLTFTFMPVLWINSTITMDYMWALMFILLGSYLAFKDRYLLSGIAVGFAIGSRFTSMFMILPIVLWALSKKADRGKILTFISTAAGTAVLLFLPVFYKYKLEFLRGSGFLSTTPLRQPATLAIESFALAINSMVMELFGIAALLLLVFSVITSLKKRSSLSITGRTHLLNFCWMTAVIYILLYLVFPYKVAYLIPLVPWGLIALNEKLRSSYTVAICILLLLNGVLSVEVLSGDTGPAVRLDSGIVLKNYEDRKLRSIGLSEEYMESLPDLLSPVK